MPTTPPTSVPAPTPVPAPVPSSFLLLHGYENQRPPSHWQRWLSLELTARGHDVRYPQLPDPDAPDFERWRDVALANLATLTEGTITVITHSASTMLWLREQTFGTAPQVDRVALVSPVSADFLESVPELAAFAWRPPEGEHEDPSARQSVGAPDAIIVAGDDDPYRPEALGAVADGLDARQIVLAGAGHVVPATGFGPWPEMLAWCLGEPAFD